ncbi:MAG: Lrp/AsnC ligand binding domain-containing protein, partial [Anaerolinea sp.]|nr:Lrp/AsnC ligand binding domain-containing protein [Anaerolinea sp.]
RIADLPEVLECYHTAGAFDLLLKVIVRDRRALEAFLQEHLLTLPGVERVETTLVLSEMKSTTALRLE